jgi:hypothetical protein
MRAPTSRSGLLRAFPHPGSLMKNILRFVLVAGCLLSGPVAYAEVQAFVQTLPRRTIPYSNAATVPCFNPDLGTLDAVELRLSVDIQGMLACENITTSPAVLDMEMRTLARAVDDAGNPWMFTLPGAQFMDVLPAFDGTLDYAGDSGRLHAGIQGTGACTAVLTEASSMGYFIFVPERPNALVNLDFLDASSGPPEAAMACRQSAGAKLTVLYHYTPGHH